MASSIRSGIERCRQAAVRYAEEEFGGECSLPTFTDSSLNILYATAYKHYQDKRYSEACDTFRLLTVLGSSQRRFWVGLAASLQLSNKFDRALEAYNVAAAMDATDPYVHFHAAECFFSLKNRGKGMAALRALFTVCGGRKKYQMLEARARFLQQVWEGETKHE